MKVEDFIISIENFPKPGVIFRDITPIFLNPTAYNECINWFSDRVKQANVNKIVAVESRGFLFAAPVSHVLGIPMALIRKKNKLPREKVGIVYQLEYGEELLELHVDSINNGDKVVLIDDVLASGGTVKASSELIKQTGGILVLGLFLIELEYLHGRENLQNLKIDSMIRYV